MIIPSASDLNTFTPECEQISVWQAIMSYVGPGGGSYVVGKILSAETITAFQNAGYTVVTEPAGNDPGYPYPGGQTTITW